MDKSLTPSDSKGDCIRQTTTRRDKGFWRGVGKVFAAIGKGTTEVAVGVFGDRPAVAPSYVRIGIRR